MYSKKERNEYNEQREKVCKSLMITKNNYNWLRRKGEGLHKLYEDNCNGDIGEASYEVETKTIYDLVNEYITSIKLYVYYQTDPRGATIYLDKEPIPENNYTRAICIW